MENMELKPTERLNRINNKKKKGGIKLYVYLLVGVLLILTVLVSLWFFTKRTETNDMVREIPLALPVETLTASISTNVDSAATAISYPPQSNNTQILNSAVKSNLPLVYANNTKETNQATTTNTAKTERQIVTEPKSKVATINNVNVQKKPIEESVKTTQNTARQVLPATNQTTIIQTTPAQDLNSQAVRVSSHSKTTTIIAQPDNILTTNVANANKTITITNKENTSNTSTQTLNNQNAREKMTSSSAPSIQKDEVKTNTSSVQRIVTTKPEQDISINNDPEPSITETKKELTTNITKQLETQVEQTQNKKSEKPNTPKESLPPKEAHLSNIGEKNNRNKPLDNTDKVPNKVKKEEVVVDKTNSPKTKKQVSTNKAAVKINNGQGGDYTIQIASATSPDGLIKLAVSQNLTTARVIETQRNGSTWYVLVTGRYASSQEAKSAIKTLPSKIQANNPWVRKSP